MFLCCLSVAPDLSLLPPSLCSFSEQGSAGWGPAGSPSSHHLMFHARVAWAASEARGPRKSSPLGLMQPRASHAVAAQALPSSAPSHSAPLHPSSALTGTRPADQHPLCTASLNHGFSVWKKLCRAGSCPFSHFSSAGVAPDLHSGSRGWGLEEEEDTTSQ